PIREEYAEARVAVIPADDGPVRETGVHLLIDLGPRLVGERDLGEFAGGCLAADCFRDVDERSVEITGPSAHEHAADLHGEVFRRMGPDPAMNLRVQENAERRLAAAGDPGFGKALLADLAHVRR